MKFWKNLWILPKKWEFPPNLRQHKIGMPVSFRTDDELVSLDHGTPVSEEAILHMLGILLSEKQIAQVTDPNTCRMWILHLSGQSKISISDSMYSEIGTDYLCHAGAFFLDSCDSNVGLPSEMIWKEITTLKRGLVL